MVLLPPSLAPVVGTLTFKCDLCGYESESKIGLGTHKGMKHKGEVGRVSGMAKDKPSESPVPGPSAANPYPPLGDWRAAEAQKTPGPSGPAPPLGPAPSAAVFDSTGLWKGLGAVINELLPDDAPMKVEVSDAQAVALDASMKQMGLNVEQRQTQVVIPWWAPFAITALSTFGLPLVAALVPLLRKKMEEGLQARKESKSRLRPSATPTTAQETEPPMTPAEDTSPGEETRPAVMAPESPPAPPAMAYHDPKEA